MPPCNTDDTTELHKNVMFLRAKVVEMTPVDKIQLKSRKTMPATSGTDQH